MHDNSEKKSDQAAFEAAVDQKFEIMVKTLIEALRLQWDDACAWIEIAIANAWQVIARGSGAAPVRNWCTYLVNSAKRMARRALKREKSAKRPQMLSLETLIEKQGFDPEAPPPVDWEERQRIIDRVREALAALPPRERLVVELFHFLHVSHGEIGAQLGITPESSKAILGRAMGRLRAMLRDLREAA